MKMNKLVTAGIACVMLLGGAVAASAAPAAAQNPSRTAVKEAKAHDTLAKRKAEAEKLGISAQGKTAQELAKEIQAKKQEQKASKQAKKQAQKAGKQTKKNSPSQAAS